MEAKEELLVEVLVKEVVQLGGLLCSDCCFE